jgi:hypothetical protein
MFCFDPDERVTGDLRGFLGGPLASECDGVRIRLFDAYIPTIMHPINRIAHCWVFVGFSAQYKGTF